MINLCQPSFGDGSKADAFPVCCDMDPRTPNPSVAYAKAAVTPRTEAVVALRYGGQAFEHANCSVELIPRPEPTGRPNSPGLLIGVGK